MRLRIDTFTVEYLIDQLGYMASYYRNNASELSPSNFSAPSSSKLASSLNDAKKCMQDIASNIESVKKFLEAYLKDVNAIESSMSQHGNPGGVSEGITSNIISRSYGALQKSFSFSSATLFDNVSEVQISSGSTEPLPQSTNLDKTLSDFEKINNGDLLLKNDATKKLMERFHLSETDALSIIHRARGLKPGELKANGKPFLIPEVLKEEDTMLNPLEALFLKEYANIQTDYKIDYYKGVQKRAQESDSLLKPIETKLKQYDYSSFEDYQKAMNTQYSLAKTEAKRDLNNFRNNQRWASRIGLSLAEISKLSDDELLNVIVNKDKAIGADYQKMIDIGNKVGYNAEVQSQLAKQRAEFEAAGIAITQLEQAKKAVPYQEVLQTKSFKDFKYDIKTAEVKKEFFDDIGEGIDYAKYKNNMDEYSFVKNCKEQYKDLGNNQIVGVVRLEAINDLQTISSVYPEYEKEYYYYLNTKGKDEANKYLKDMSGTFAQLAGEINASKRLEHLKALPEKQRNEEITAWLGRFGDGSFNTAVASVYGVGDGVTGWAENVSHIGDGKRSMSSSEWEKNYFRGALSSEKSKGEAKYIINDNGVKKSSSELIDYTKNYGFATQFGYDVGQGVGNMLPAMAVSYGLAPAGAALAQAGSLGTMGLGVYGNTYHNYMVQGHSESKAHLAAGLSAAAEIGTESVYGGFSFLNSGPVYNLKTLGVSMFKEGMQEVFQDANEPLIHSFVTGEKLDFTNVNPTDLLKQVGYTWLVGGATAGAMNVPGYIGTSRAINANQSNLSYIGKQLNTGNINIDQANVLLQSTLGLNELENSDVMSILKMNKNGLSTIHPVEGQNLNPHLVLALNSYSQANQLSSQQQSLLNNNPGLASLLSNSASSGVPGSLKNAYDAYQNLETKLGEFGDQIKNSAKAFKVNAESLNGINQRMNDLLNNSNELQDVLEKYDAGNKVQVPKEIVSSFNEYLTLRSKEGIINQQLEEIATTKNSTGVVEQFGKVKSYLSDVVSSYLSGALESQTVGIVPPVVRDFMQSPISHPIESVKDLINQYYNQHNISFFDRINFVNNQTDPTTVGELKQGIIEAIPSGLSKMEQARFAYLALSQQLGFDENLNSNPSDNSYFDVKRKYDSITDDTILNKKTVCVSWARIYSDILTSLGIDNKYQAMNHAWVEFDADGIIIKADATTGNVMDLSRAKFGQETENFYPINGYSPDVENGKISYRVYQDPSLPGSFDEALKQIDKNIHYIQDEYRSINENAIINDVNTSLTDKLNTFSKEVLEGMDFVGAKSLLLNFTDTLKENGDYNISGTDMVKLQKDGSIDILNITSILDENGQYRYFALHENMGLTEITARDLDVLQSNGYLLDNAKKLAGYQYNAVTGAVNSLINKVVSKVATIVNPNLLEHTESVLSNGVTTLLTQNNNTVNQSVNNETQSIVIDIAPLSFSKFNALSVSDMIQYIQNNFTVDSSEIINLFDMWDTLDPKICEAIRTKMIQDQNYIFSSKYLTILGRDLSKVVNSDMLEQLSDLSLCRLLATSDLNHLDADMILQEIERRLDNGNLVVDQYLFQQTKNEGGFELDEFNNFASKISTEVGEKISALANASVTEEIRELSAKYRKGDINLTQLLLLRRVLNEDHSPIVIEILDDLIQANPKNMNTFNFELLNPNIINLLGKDFIESIGNYQNMSNLVMDIYKSDPELLTVYAKGLSYLNQYSDTIFKNSASALLNFLHSNAQYFRNENLDAFSSEDIINYALSYGLFENNLKLDSRGFKYSLNQYCDSLLDSAVLISDLQDAYLLKTYSMNRDIAEKFLSTYSESINDLPGLDHSILDMVDDIKSVLNMNSDSFDLLKEKIQNSHSVTPIEVEEVKFKIRDKVFAQFEEDFKKTNDVYGSLKGFQEVQVDGLFSLLVKSTNSGIAGTDSDVSKGYVDYFKSQNPKSHLLAGSYINNNCLYTAGENGILFGWSNMSKDDMKLMGVKDIKSDILSYGYTSTRDQKYVTPASMTQLTNSEYNELDTINKMPQYVVVKADASDVVRQNSLNAAKELDIPVLYLPDANASNLNLNDSSVQSASILDDSSLDNLSQQFDSSLSEAVKLTSLQRLMNIGQQVRHFITNPNLVQYVLNQGNQVLNTPTFFSHPLETTIASIVNPLISKFMFNSNVVNNTEMSNKILNEGLYHFVMEDATMDKIMDSHKFLATTNMGELFVNTAFFFAGVPSFNEACYHLNKGNKPVDKIRGFRLNVDPSKLSEYQYRAGHDGVVMHLGDVVFKDEDITPVYLVAKEEQGKINYVEVSKEEYTNYQSEISSDNTDQFIRGMISEFSQNVDNVERFNRVFKDFKIGLTNGTVVNSFASNLVNLLNIMPGVKVDLPINKVMNGTNKTIDLQNRLETLKKENPGIEEEYIRIQKEISLEHAVRLTPEMVEYRSIMHQLGLDKESSKVESLDIEDETFTVNDLKSKVLYVSLSEDTNSTVTIVDSKKIYDIIFNHDTYKKFIDFNSFRNEFEDISYPIYLRAIDEFIGTELKGRNFGNEISSRISNLLELVKKSNDYLNPLNNYSNDVKQTSFVVKRYRLSDLIDKYPALLTNQIGVPSEIIKEAELLKKELNVSLYDLLLADSAPCIELSNMNIDGKTLSIPVELIESILTNEKIYQAFLDFDNSTSLFGNLSAKNYYKAIMLYYLSAKKAGKSMDSFKNLDGLISNMEKYLNRVECGIINNSGKQVILNTRLYCGLKDYLDYLDPKSIIVSGQNRYTLEQAKNILNNNSGIIPETFYEGLHSVDIKPFSVEINVTQELPNISWLESVLNDQKVFDDVMNHFDFKSISSKIESLQNYVEQIGDSITELQLNRYNQLFERYKQVADVLNHIQSNVFKHPQIHDQIKNIVSKQLNKSIRIQDRVYDCQNVLLALDAMQSGLQDYQLSCQAFKDFASILFTGKRSDTPVLKNVYNAFVDAYNNGDQDLALAYLNNLSSIKRYFPEFCFTSNTVTKAFFSGSGNCIELGKQNQAAETIYHEITHAFDYYNSGYKVSTEWDDMIKRTRDYLLKNNTYKRFSDDANRASNDAAKYADYVLEKRFNKSKQQIIKDLEIKYKNMIDAKEEFLEKMNQRYGLNERDRMAPITNYSPENLAEIEYGLMAHVVYDYYMRTKYPEISAVSDMIEGIFSDKYEDLKKYKIFTPYNHGKEYYGELDYANAVEAIANFGSIAFTRDGLFYLRNILGEEYFDMLNQKHHDIVWRGVK